MLKDVNYSIRKLVNRPGFAAIVVITLALTIGANTAIFSVVDAVLLRPLPYRDADRLVKVFESVPEKQRSRNMVSLGDFNEWQSQCQSFEDMAALAYVGLRMNGPTAEEVLGSRVSSNFFQFLGVTPALGRTFLPEDAATSDSGAVILTHAFWVSHFGADPNVINKTITLSTRPYIIVGVLPASFHETFESRPARTQIWTTVNTGNQDGTRTGPGAYTVIARLKRNVTLEQSRSEIRVVAERLAQSYPKTNTGVTATVYSLHEEVTNSTRQSLVVLFAAVGLVLLIACANIANLLLSRSLEQSKEVAIRLAIGAGRRHVIQQLLTESLLLSLFGGLLGWFVASWILRVIVPLIPPTLPRSDEIHLDYRSLLFTLGISVFATLLFGLSPAFQTVKINLTDTLKACGRTASERLRSRQLRHTLIVVQVALTTVLLIGAGLLTNSLVRLYRVDPGFDTHNLLSTRLSLPRKNGEVPERWNEFWSSFLESSLRVPGTEAAALVNPQPLGETRYTMNVGLPASEAAPVQDITIGYNTVSTNYFRMVGIRLLSGREFNSGDVPQSLPVIVVNQSFAEAYFPNQQVLAKSVLLKTGSGDAKAATIVGVVADSRARLNEPTEPQFYQSMSQFPQPSMYLLARTTTDETSYFTAIRGITAALAPGQPLGEQMTMDALWAEYTVRPRFYLSLFAGLALLGLTLASVGVYGLLSHNVSQLTHEIGIRRALGARDSHVLRIVVLKGMTLSALGVVGGLIAAGFLSRLIREWLFEVGPTDPSTFAVVAISLLFVALLACYFPARRATKVDPLVALRYE